MPERSFAQIKEWTPKSELCCEQGHPNLYLQISKTLLFHQYILVVQSIALVTDSVFANSPTHLNLFVNPKSVLAALL